MRDFISIAKPIIGEEEVEAVGEVLRSGMLTQGETVKRFEEEFSEYLGVKNSVAVSNGTVALDLALKGLGLRPGDEVISPAFTFIATAKLHPVPGGETSLCRCGCQDIQYRPG